MSLCTPAAALETTMRLQGLFYRLGGLDRVSGEHLGQQELPCKPHIPHPASHLRLTDEAQTHHYSLEEAAQGNTQVRNELLENTYLPHELAFPVHAKVEIRLLPFDPDLTAKSVCFH